MCCKLSKWNMFDISSLVLYEKFLIGVNTAARDALESVTQNQLELQGWYLLQIWTLSDVSLLKVIKIWSHVICNIELINLQENSV